MESRAVFRNISPLDHRYYQANRELFEQLSDYLSEDASVRYCVDVEAALLRAHLRRTGADTPENLAAIASLRSRVTPEAVYEAERETRHNIRALVRVIKRHLPPSVTARVHLGATSVDILDTAFSLRIRDVTGEVLVPLLVELERHLISLTRTHAETLQAGRTHGQHGVPITFGFALSEYVSRLGKSVERVSSLAGDLRGKIAGAMGAYNSMSMIVPDPVEFEREVLGELGMEPADHATQMVQPEYLLRLLLELNTAFGIIANLADDLRNLQRTEIDEVRERFADAQVGSSTMPQKRNPWNSEHVKSLWKAFAPRVVTFFSDQISEHQRDLTNSASSRFVADYIAGFAAAATRMTSILSGLGVDVDRMRRNAEMTGDMILAEAAYTLLATEGVPDAHERIRVAALAAADGRKPLSHVLRDDRQTWNALGRALARVSEIGPDQFFGDAAGYTGRSAEVARRLANDYEKRMNAIREGDSS